MFVNMKFGPYVFKQVTMSTRHYTRLYSTLIRTKEESAERDIFENIFFLQSQ